MASAQINQEDGFSNDEETEEEVLINQSNGWRQLMECNDQKIGLKIQNEGREITKKSYSLEPDMITG